MGTSNIDTESEVKDERASDFQSVSTVVSRESSEKFVYGSGSVHIPESLRVLIHLREISGIRVGFLE